MHPPSETELMLSRAWAADLNGENATNFTTPLKRLRLVTDSSTWGRKEPTSSNSLTLNRPYPAACSKSTYSCVYIEIKSIHQTKSNWTKRQANQLTIIVSVKKDNGEMPAKMLLASSIKHAVRIYARQESRRNKWTTASAWGTTCCRWEESLPEMPTIIKYGGGVAACLTSHTLVNAHASVICIV